jgi:hypothetical protein
VKQLLREGEKAMDNVLPFPRDGRRSEGNETANKPPTAKGAEILLFLGVRYERHPDQPQNAAGASQSRDDRPTTPPGRKTRRRA